jgi:hypothetical protein
MLIIALTNFWASLNVTKPLDNNRIGLLGKAVGYFKAKGF